jgi:hypothetical protein
MIKFSVDANELICTRADGDCWIFRYLDGQEADVIRAAASYAERFDLRFSWYDVAYIRAQLLLARKA